MSTWKAINGYATLYMVSKDGEVKSLGTGKILKPRVNHKGYLIVQLSCAGEKKNKRIHRLVAETFIPNTKNLPEVDHINGKRDDNRACNLRWVSGSANTRNREVCRNASSHYNGVYYYKKSGRWVSCVTHNRKTVYLGTFVTDTAAALAFNQFCIENNLNRELNKIKEV